MIPLPRFMLQRAERALNALLQRDPATPRRLESLAGRTLLLHLTAPTWHVALTGTTVGLRIENSSLSSADVTITLTPTALGTLLGGTDMATLALQGEIQVAGGIELAQQFKSLLSQLDPDVEGVLAQLIGDIPAHLLLQQCLRQRKQAQRLWLHFRANSADYVTEEARIVVGDRQLHVIRDQLDELTRQLERSERRVAHLEFHDAFVQDAVVQDKKEPYA